MVKNFICNTILVGAMALMTTQAAFALDRRVSIVNDTNYDIIRFYGSNKGSKSWEEDILGSDILPAGSTVQINFDDNSGYCKFDFKAVFSDDDVLIRKNVNICEIGTFTYN